MGLRALVVINKIGRPNVEPEKVMDPVFDLFDSLGATAEQIDFPSIYASGREGFAIRQLSDEKKDLAPLLDLIIEQVPPPDADPDAPLCMQVATLDYDDFLGYVAIGRMRAGTSKVGDRVLFAHRDTYLKQCSNMLVILLAGGSKKTQERDIQKARMLARGL